jgi:hypothetical protein
LRFTSRITGKQRDAGLGIYPEVSIADARFAVVVVLAAPMLSPAEAGLNSTAMNQSEQSQYFHYRRVSDE